MNVIFFRLNYNKIMRRVIFILICLLITDYDYLIKDINLRVLTVMKCNKLSAI
jgi:hypothetical protein